MDSYFFASALSRLNFRIKFLSVVAGVGTPTPVLLRSSGVGVPTTATISPRKFSLDNALVVISYNDHGH